MKLEQSFEVEAPLDEVWAALVDVERVAPCLPGAAVTGRNDDGTYNGTFTIKIGPTTAAYTGKLEMQNIDEAAHSATMHAQGTDKRGQGGATATIASRLTSANGGTRVDVVTDYHITGRLARFGRGGMIEDISERLLREFAGRLQSSLAGSGAAGADTGAGADAAAGAGPSAAAAAGESAAAGAGESAAAGAGEASEQPTTDTVTPPPTEAASAEAQAEAAEAAAEAAEAAPARPPREPAPPPPPPHAPPPPDAAPPPPPPQTPPTESAPPVQGLSLVGGVLLDRVKRNPAPLVAVVSGLILLRLLLRRR